MSYSDIHITHIHITEDLSSTGFNCFKDCVNLPEYMEMLLCGDLSELLEWLCGCVAVCVCVCWCGHHFEVYWSSYNKS